MKRTSPSKKATDLRSKAGGRSVGKNGCKTIDWYMPLRKALLLTLVQRKLPKIILWSGIVERLAAMLNIAADWRKKYDNTTKIHAACGVQLR